MALKLSARYAGQTSAPSVAYPHGSARDVNNPGDGTGTPWQKDLVNDWLGFFQSLLVDQSVTPSEVPDEVGASQYFAALLAMITSRTDPIANKTSEIFSPLNNGAVGDNVADDTAELQACFDEAYAAVVGSPSRAPVTVDLGGRRYRTTAALTAYPHVNVINGRITLDHATANVIVFTTAATLNSFANWEDVELDCAQANTGTIIVATSVVLARFARCPLNQSSNCSQRLLIISAASDIIVEDVTAKVCLSNDGITVQNGKLRLIRGKFSPPAAFASSVLRINGGTNVNIQGVHFDLSLTTSGTAACVHFTSANVEIVATGNIFDDGNNNGNVAFRSTTLSDNQGRLTERGNRYVGAAGSEGMQPFDLSGFLTLGASVEGLPHNGISTSDADIAVATHSKVVTVRSTRADTTPANLTFADPVFAGQVLHVQVANDHTSGWSGFITLANVIHQPAEPDLEDLAANSGERLFLTLVAHRYESFVDWYLESIHKYILP